MWVGDVVFDVVDGFGVGGVCYVVFECVVVDCCL